VQGSWLWADRRTKKIAESLDVHFLILGGGQRGNRIVMKFCMGVGVHDVITHANLGDDQFRFFLTEQGQISHFSIDLSCRP